MSLVDSVFANLNYQPPPPNSSLKKLKNNKKIMKGKVNLKTPEKILKEKETFH